MIEATDDVIMLLDDETARCRRSPASGPPAITHAPRAGIVGGDRRRRRRDCQRRDQRSARVTDTRR
jgi:hypothetical protein